MPRKKNGLRKKQEEDVMKDATKKREEEAEDVDSLLEWKNRRMYVDSQLPKKKPIKVIKESDSDKPPRKCKKGDDPYRVPVMALIYDYGERVARSGFKRCEHKAKGGWIPCYRYASCCALIVADVKENRKYIELKRPLFEWDDAYAEDAIHSTSMYDGRIVGYFRARKYLCAMHGHNGYVKDSFPGFTSLIRRIERSPPPEIT